MLLIVDILRHTKGRPPGRPLFLCVALLLCAPSAFAQDPLVRDVVVSGPDTDTLIMIPEPSANLPVDAPPPAGRGLLRFYGCVTCHDLAVPPFRGRWGPDLDTVGSKSPASVLEQTLIDPRSVRADAMMPIVPMSDSTRSVILDLLVSLTRDLPVPPDPDLDGAALYERGDCRQCHIRDGRGGDRGPSLEGVGERVRASWLAAYLLDPSEMIPNSRMPLFEWEVDEAAALARYLANADEVETERRVDRRSEGVSVAAQLGCFQCHRIGRFALTLDLPADENARPFIDHHRSGPSEIRIQLTDAQVEAMSEALNDEPPGSVADSTFLASFWKTPIPLQGTAPATHDSLSAGLHPEDCAACHRKQHDEWASSLHAAAMGPGVIGQLIDDAYDNPSFVTGCQECHAPNAEQHAALPAGNDHEVNYRFDSALRSQGITCVACHVRAHTRFGPPISDGAPVQIWRGPGHGGGHENSAYTRSEFCSPCHQFGQGDRRMNGTLIQDTYNEWRQSPQARDGQTCQYCHMPDRSHTWLGIHDSATVASAIEVDVSDVQIEQDDVSASIRVRNTGAGHHLPTYVTPKILVTATLLDGNGLPLGRSRENRAIGREIVLSGQEGREVYDTRIPAGGEWVWQFGATGQGAAAVSVKLVVYPDHFYAAFFEAFDRTSLSAEASAAIELAAQRTKASHYTVFEQSFPLYAR